MKYEPVKNIEDLEVGDIVKGKSSGYAFIVTANYGDRVTAVLTVDITNAIEWEVLKATPKEQTPDSSPDNSGL
jgi:hypothetical protein